MKEEGLYKMAKNENEKQIKKDFVKAMIKANKKTGSKLVKVKIK